MLRLKSALAVVAVLLALALTAGAALACNKNFEVYNRSDYTIVKFFVAPTSVGNWEDNVLQSDIEPDTHARIDMSADDRDVSLYDVRAVFEDDNGHIDGGKINLCRARSIYIYNDRVTFSDSDS